MVRVHLNEAALQRRLKSPEADEQRKQLAEAIADGVRRQGIEVGAVTEGEFATTGELPVHVTDDGNVVLAHPAGQAVEAKYGALVKAAAELGLEVKSQ